MRSVQHNTASRLALHRDARGAQLALVDEDRRLDYRALDDRIARCAALLAANGIARGDRVALVLGNRTAYLETVLAAARLGAIATPLNARLTAPELHALLADATPRVLIHEDDDEVRMQAACRDLPAPPAARIVCGGSASPYERALASVPPARFEPSRPDEPMILMYTSGTTGMPKGALLPTARRSTTTGTPAPASASPPTTGCSSSCRCSTRWASRSWLCPRSTVARASSIQEGFDAERIWQTRRARGDQLSRRRADRPSAPARGPREARASARRLRFLFTAGAAAPAELIRAYRSPRPRDDPGLRPDRDLAPDLPRLPTAPSRRPAASAVRCPTPRSASSSRRRSKRPADCWRDVGEGEVGEIVVRGPITMLGYWQRPEATRETLRGEWLRTGDLATRDADFDITLVGRAPARCTSRAARTSIPAEVEARARQPSRCARRPPSCAIPDARWGEVGRAHRRREARARSIAREPLARLAVASGSPASSSPQALRDRRARSRAPRAARSRSTASRNGPGRSGGWARTNDLRLMKPAPL